MIKKYVKIISILILVLFLNIVIKVKGNTVFADNAPTNYSCNISIEPNKEEIKKGETVTLSVKVSNIQGGDGISGVVFAPVYTTNSFDCDVNSTDSEVWERLEYDGASGQYLVSTSGLTPTSEDAIVAEIVLTANENLTAGNQTIELKNIVVNFVTGDTNQNYTVPDKTVTIAIIEDQQGDNNSQGEGNTNEGDNNQQGENGQQDNGQNQGNEQQDNSQQQDEGQQDNSNEQDKNQEDENYQDELDALNEIEDEKDDNKTSNQQTESTNSDNGQTSENKHIFPKTGIASAVVPLIIAIASLAGISYFKYRQINIK